MKHKHCLQAVLLSLFLFAATGVMAADLGIAGIEGIGGSLEYDLILKITGDLERARDFNLEVEWDKPALHKRRGKTGTMGHGTQTLKNPKIDLSQKTLTFHSAVKKAGERRAACTLHYTINGDMKSTSTITSDWITIRP